MINVIVSFQYFYEISFTEYLPVYLPIMNERRESRKGILAFHLGFLGHKYLCRRKNTIYFWIWRARSSYRLFWQVWAREFDNQRTVNLWKQNNRFFRRKKKCRLRLKPSSEILPLRNRLLLLLKEILVCHYQRLAT